MTLFSSLKQNSKKLNSFDENIHTSFLHSWTSQETFFLNIFQPKLLKVDLVRYIKMLSIWEWHGIYQIHPHFPIYISHSQNALLKLFSLVFSSGIRENLVSPTNKNIIAHQYHLSAITKLFRLFATQKSSLTYPQLWSNCLRTFLEEAGIYLKTCMCVQVHMLPKFSSAECNVLM